MKFYTIGHSTKTFEEFLDLIKFFGIEIVIDVRRFPSSKKFPWFNKESLEMLLKKNGIGYIHLEELGGYREQGYLAYTKTNEFKKGIQKLEKICKKKKCVIMCSEWKWWKCHRRYIANELAKRGHKVFHILTKERIEEHKIKSKYIQQKLKTTLRCDKIKKKS